jgi:hypothetical protein
MFVVACGRLSGVTAEETVLQLWCVALLLPSAVAGLGNIRGVHSDVSASSTDGQASLLMQKGRLRSGMLRNVKVAA